MKPSILNQLSWQDIREIVTEAHLMSTIPETEVEYYTPEAYYTELLNRLKQKQK